MKTFISKFILFLAILSVAVTSACSAAGAPAPADGEVVTIYVGQVISGIRLALSGSPNTFILVQNDAMVLIWPLKDGWAFVALNVADKTGFDIADQITQGGNFVNPKTIGDLTSFLKEQGWKVIPASELPVAMTAAVSGAGHWLVTLANSLPTFIFMPSSGIEKLIPSPDPDSTKS